MANMPRVLLAAPASGSGKTLITCGILQALVNRQLHVKSFKCGPDFIDPMFHTKVIGTPSRNLDTFFTDREMTRYLFARQAEDADISVMEGVMGYYDGVAGISTQASAYDLADTTGTPVILIINAKGMSLSLVPMIRGFLEYREAEEKEGAKDQTFPTRSHIAGVILNQMSKMMYPEVKQRIEAELGIHVFGYVPKVTDCVIESRHLGLVTPDEIEGLQDRLKKLAGILEESLELDEILALAQTAEPIAVCPPELVTDLLAQLNDLKPVRIAVAKDEAFCFYYEDNLDLLRDCGAQIVEFSPMRDEKLPEEIDGLILGGGYPELYAKRLSENETMKTAIREQIEKGLPYFAECGGFLYLHRTMEDMNGVAWPMAGVIDGDAVYTGKLGRFGYVNMTLLEDSIYGTAGLETKAHEFHYFDSSHNGSSFHAQKPLRKRNWDCVNANGRGAAGFPHFYYYANPQMVSRFLEMARIYQEER